jgi:hypothetical protein
VRANQPEPRLYSTALHANRCRVYVVDETFGSLRRGEDLEELSDILLARDRVVDRELGVDRVLVAAPISLARDVPGGGELDDDAMRGTLGDPDPFTDLAQSNAWIVSDADQYLGVVGQERPTRCAFPNHHF